VPPLSEAAAANATVLPLSAPYDPRHPPEGIFDDEWMEIFLAGRKMGYAHDFFRRQGDTVFSGSRTILRLGRLDNVVSVSVQADTEETLDGSPRAFHCVVNMAQQPQVVDGHGDGTVFDVTAQSGSFSERQQVTLPAGAVMAWGEQRLSLLRGYAPGIRYTYQSYAPEDDYTKPELTSVVVGGREKVTVQGAEIEATRVDTRVGGANGTASLDSVSWVDAAGREVKTLLPFAGFTLEMRPATAKQALADYVPADIFTTSLIALKNPIPANATSVTYDLRRHDGQPLPTPPDSLTEHGKNLPDGSAQITLAWPPAAAAWVPRATGPFDPAPYLERNSFMDTSDPLLRQLAAEGGGPANALPLNVAASLRDFVAAYITNKTLGVGFATASEAARDRAGDCTEHAVLLAALGRVRGLPTRVVAGLAYVPDYNGGGPVLGYHMWAQFYLNGQWVDYDAALSNIPGPPRRLGLVVRDLNHDSLADFSLSLWQWMSGLEVTVTAGTSPSSAR
jgi:hypothetical protein